MSLIPNWSPTAYYNQGDRVFYIDTPYQLIVAGNTPGVFGVTPPSNPAAWAPAPFIGPIYQATYYKSANQNLANGSTDVTFDVVEAGSNIGGFMTHINGTTVFTVVIAGLYQLEFNASVLANAATWNTGTSKSIFIDITRSPTTEQAIIGQTATVATTTNYSQSVSSIFRLAAGDVINLRIFCPSASATPQAAGISNVIDLGTWFSWRYISA